MTKSMKKRLYRLIVGAALWALPLDFLGVAWIGVGKIFLAYLIVSYDILLKAGRNILRLNALDENFLMTVASLGAFLIGEAHEALAVMLFYQVGELFQDYAVGKSRKSVASLMDIRPDEATVLTDGAAQTVFAGDVPVGSVILVRPGQRVPLDGVLLSEACVLDTAALTGESLPQQIERGDMVYSGSVNLDQAIEVRVTSDYENSTVGKILDLVENASAKKSAPEKFITRFARVYTPIVVALAVLLAAIPPIFAGWVTFPTWLSRALTFLVVSCPCALVISIPLSFFGGIGGASKMGVLIKGGNALEALAKVHTVAFDKTGTLTQGSFTLTACESVDQSFDDAEILRIAAHVESVSTHPLARSIVSAYESAGGQIDLSVVRDVVEISGKGVRACVNGAVYLCGGREFAAAQGAPVDKMQDKRAGAVLYLVQLGASPCVCGVLTLQDQLKPDAQAAVEALKSFRVRSLVCLTGDSEENARAAAQQLGLSGYYARLLPENKVERVEALREKLPAGRTLAFVGDGINDAPVLARADVGVAMGALGSDAAIEAADVVLMHDAPSRLADTIRLAKFTMRIARENILLALGVKVAVLILSAFGLAGMYAAVFADVGVAVLCILNAMRTLAVKRFS